MRRLVFPGPPWTVIVYRATACVHDYRPFHTAFLDCRASVTYIHWTSVFIPDQKNMFIQDTYTYELKELCMYILDYHARQHFLSTNAFISIFMKVCQKYDSLGYFLPIHIIYICHNMTCVSQKDLLLPHYKKKLLIGREYR